MGQYGDEGYEPSADELIDVLKNLENLAAANPGLYRTIVEQIKGNQGELPGNGGEAIVKMEIVNSGKFTQ